MREKTIEELESEANIAADVLEQFLDTSRVDGDLQMSLVNNRILIEVVGGGESARRLIGKDGEVLLALQYIVHLIVKHKLRETTKLLVDVDNYRTKRNDKILKNAADVIESVKLSGEEFQFDPMNSFERKLIHDLARENGLHSYSVGKKTERRLIITPNALFDEGTEESEDSESDDE
jgi:spoIIIJ-associated protein